MSRPLSTSAATIPNPEALVAPEGPVAIDEASAELLAGLGENLRIRDYREEIDRERAEESDWNGEAAEDVDVDPDAEYHKRMAHARGLPWWRRPSIWWQLGLVPFATIAATATMASRIAVYTQLACKIHRPDISGMSLGGFYATETCAQDPTVQAAVAKLTAVIVTSSGILSALTTSWWSSRSDFHGRLKIQSIATIGQILTDSCLIFTALNILSAGTSSRLPGGYWFLILGPICEGLLGGLTTSQAMATSYLTDLTSEGDRSRVLSLSVGLMFSGLAFGPTLASLVVRYTHSILSVFYLSVSLQLAFLMIIVFIMPESLLDSQMQKAKERRKHERELQRKRDAEDEATGEALLNRMVKKTTRTVKGALSPLTIFVLEDRNEVTGAKRRDWNLVLLISSYGIALTVMGAYTYKFQYAQAAFHWGPEEIGYWLTIIGVARGIFMTLILPLAIKIFKPKPYIIEIPPDSPSVSRYRDVPSANDPISDTSPLLQPPPSHKAPVTKELHSPSFDLSLCRISLVIELIGYTILALSANPIVFAISGIVGAFGSGFAPALQSVSLGMYMRKGGKENGRLFGAIGLVQSLTSAILGPVIYGIIYASTVATRPRTIFFASVLNVLIALFCLALVRVPKVGENPGDRLRRQYQDDVEAESRSILIVDRRTSHE